MTHRIASAFVILAVALGFSASADASAIRVSDGYTITTISDGGAGDLNALTDAVTFAGSVGTWSFNITTGSSSSDPTAPLLELSSFNVSSIGGGTLSIWFTDTFLGPSSTSVVADIDGLTTGSVKYQTYQSTTNEAFTSTQLTQGTYTGVFSDADAALLASGSYPYSLTQQVTITHGVLGGLTTFSGSLQTVGGAQVSVPDGGSTAMSLGIALLGLAALKRRFPALPK